MKTLGVLLSSVTKLAEKLLYKVSNNQSINQSINQSLVYYTVDKPQPVNTSCLNTNTIKTRCSLCSPWGSSMSSIRRRHRSINDFVNETLWKFLPFSSYHSLKLFTRIEFSIMVNMLLKSLSNSVINGIFPCHAKISVNVVKLIYR